MGNPNSPAEQLERVLANPEPTFMDDRVLPQVQTGAKSKTKARDTTGASALTTTRSPLASRFVFSDPNSDSAPPILVERVGNKIKFTRTRGYLAPGLMVPQANPEVPNEFYLTEKYLLFKALENMNLSDPNTVESIRQCCSKK